MKDKLGFLWEEFVGEKRTIDCKNSAARQVLEFTMQIVFEESLLEAGFEPEEAIEVYIADSELRMPPEAPKTMPEMEEITIFLN
jgi:hypothetical protein